MEVSGQLHASAALLPWKAPAQPLHKSIVSNNNNNKFPNRWIGRGGTQLATTVTGSEPIRFPCVGLHESYGACTHGELERTTP